MPQRLSFRLHLTKSSGFTHSAEITLSEHAHSLRIIANIHLIFYVFYDIVNYLTIILCRYDRVPERILLHVGQGSRDSLSFNVSFLCPTAAVMFSIRTM